MDNTTDNTFKEVIVGIKRYRNQQLSEQLNLNHYKDVTYTDEKLKCCFAFPIYECPPSMDVYEPNTIQTLNGKYCVFLVDVQMGLPYWYKIQDYLETCGINCRD